MEFYEEHKSMITKIIIALVVAVVVYYLYNRYVANKGNEMYQDDIGEGGGRGTTGRGMGVDKLYPFDDESA